MTNSTDKAKMKINMSGIGLPQKAQEEFEPSKFAKKNCRLGCGGRGWLRVHMAINRKVVPKDNNIEHKPCGCAIRRYKKKLQADHLASLYIQPK